VSSTITVPLLTALDTTWQAIQARHVDVPHRPAHTRAGHPMTPKQSLPVQGTGQ
jgi:hypothetical protein